MSNRLFRLSELLAPKYGFNTTASIKTEIEDIKNEIINAYNLYVTDDTIPVPKINPVTNQSALVNKYRVIPELASLDEPTSKYIFTTMKKLMDNIVEVEPDALYIILGRLADRMTNEKIQDIINFYQDKVALPKHVDLKLRAAKIKNIKDTFKRLSSIINGKQKALQKFTNKVKEFKDKSYVPPVEQIGRDDLMKFMRMPYVSQIGLTDYGILAELLDEPGGRALITNVYNSIQRGHIPQRGNELWSAILSLKELYNMRAKDNTGYFESSTKSPSPLVSPFEEASFSEPSFRSPEAVEKARKEKEEANKGEGI